MNKYEILLRRINTAINTGVNDPTLLSDVFDMTKKLEGMHSAFQEEVKYYYNNDSMSASDRLENVRRLRTKIEKTITAYNTLVNLIPKLLSRGYTMSGAEVGETRSSIATPVDTNTKATTSNNGKSNTVVSAIAIGAAALALIVSLKGCSIDKNLLNRNDTGTSIIGASIDESEKTDKEETVDEVKNVSYADTILTDASDNEQVMARSKEIYDKYCVPYLNKMSPENREQAMNVCTVENIANIIRVRNGEYPINEDGEEYYNDSTLDDIANLQATIFANYPSSDEFKKDIFFVPSYLTMIDGSLSQKSMKEIDDKMEAVVEARRSGDYEAFREAAKIWGYEFTEQFIKIDFNGQNSIFASSQIGRYNYAYDVLKKYVTVIFEVTRECCDSICIDFCETNGTTEQRSLSQLVDMYTNQTYDWLSDAVGTQEQHDAIATTGFAQSYNLNSDYFSSKVDRTYKDGMTLALK